MPESSGPLLHTPANSAPSYCPLRALSADSPSLRTAVPPVTGKGAAVGTCKPHPGLVMISRIDYRPFTVGNRGSFATFAGIIIDVLTRTEATSGNRISAVVPLF